MLNYLIPVYVTTISGRGYYIRKRLAHGGYEVTYAENNTGNEMLDISATHVCYCDTLIEAENTINNIK